MIAALQSLALYNNRFVLHSKTADIAGLFSDAAKLDIADGAQWNSLATLLKSQPDTKQPVVVAHTILRPGQPLIFAMQRLRGGLPGLIDAGSLPQVFKEAEDRRREISEQITVETPDPFINAAVPALCMAADGVWDSQQKAYMHGAVAWRRKLLGWRGAYTGDELGQHDRTRDHLMNWLPQQNTGPVPETMPPDESVRLARNEPALHSNGDLSKSHYDMNLPAIDILFRHLLWTGDLDFARQQWPVIERHLAWEQRLFRRPFGPDKLPLYEAYCCIWASDDLQYHGGGATHSTAYNFYHNKMAAVLAKRIGKDPSPYEREAALILKPDHHKIILLKHLGRGLHKPRLIPVQGRHGHQARQDRQGRQEGRKNGAAPPRHPAGGRGIGAGGLRGVSHSHDPRYHNLWPDQISSQTKPARFPSLAKGPMNPHGQDPRPPLPGNFRHCSGFR